MGITIRALIIVIELPDAVRIFLDIYCQGVCRRELIMYVVRAVMVMFTYVRQVLAYLVVVLVCGFIRGGFKELYIQVIVGSLKRFGVMGLKFMGIMERLQYPLIITVDAPEGVRFLYVVLGIRYIFLMDIRAVMGFLVQELSLLLLNFLTLVLWVTIPVMTIITVRNGAGVLLLTTAPLGILGMAVIVEPIQHVPLVVL